MNFRRNWISPSPLICYTVSMRIKKIRQFSLTYLLTLVALLGVDLLWLSIVAGDFYEKHYETLATGAINWPPAIIFYLFYVFAILYFAVVPGARGKSLKKTLGSGALLGATAYGAYDLTNLATLQSWSLQLTLVDLLWGITLTTIVSGVGYFVFLWSK